MKKEMTLRIKAKAVTKYEKGWPLISKETVDQIELIKEEGTLLKLVDPSGGFVARGYYGRQNKGYGWVLTQDSMEIIDHSFFVRKLEAAIAYRRSFFTDPETTAFRLFNGEGDGIGGLIIDYYDGHLVIHWYSEGIYTFKEQILSAIKETASPKSIYQKKRFDTNGKYVDDDDFVAGEPPEFPLIVKENGVNFAVYLNDGAMVGVFLDQREVRRRIRDHYAKGTDMLNMFSYTGAFSVFAALGGANATTSVDLANRSLPKTKEQLELNGIDSETQRIVVMDVFKYFKYAQKKDLQYDLVVLDPPSFAKSKKVVFSASKDYKDLMKQTISITKDGGVIVASTNAASFDMKKFKSFISDAFKESGGTYEILEQYSLPRDFKTISSYKEGNYLKVLFIKKITG